MKEPQVLRKTHKFLKSQGLASRPVARLFTDAHSSLLPYADLTPFQRFTIDMNDFVLHPDIVGQLDDGETVFAVEAKGDADLLKGLIQAEMYQVGFHLSFLAADSAALGTSLINFARQRNIGIIAVSDSVKIASPSEPRMPFREAFRFIMRQMESVTQVYEQQTFQFNVPTHYLVWVIALQPNVGYPLGSVSQCLAAYPMPSDWRSALRGAQKLGLVNIRGPIAQLSDAGTAIKTLLPESIIEWARIHKKIAAKGASIPLTQVAPQAAAVL